MDYFYYERGTVMCKKILFCNLSYMKFYNEITEYDKPCNGGKYVNDNNYAHEKIILKYMMMIFVMVMYQDMIEVKSWTYLR